jgi:hypothetical protein
MDSLFVSFIHHPEKKRASAIIYRRMKNEKVLHTHTQVARRNILHTQVSWLEGRLEAENKRLFFFLAKKKKKKKKDITHRVHGQQLLPAVERFFSHAAVASYPILSLPFAMQESVYVCVFLLLPSTARARKVS